MFCKNCGKEIVSGKYCQYCGYKLTNDKKESDTIKGKPVLYIKIIISVIVLILLIIGMIGIFSRGKENENATDANISDNLPKAEETDIYSTNTPEPHSIWFEGTEFKILEYLDEENMLVQISLGNCEIQAIVPRNLEKDTYECEYNAETSETGNGQEVSLKLSNSNCEDVIYFCYVQGEEFALGLEEEFKEVQNLVDNESVVEVQTIGNGTGIVFGTDMLPWHEYDNELKELPGCGLLIWDSEKQMSYTMLLYNKDGGYIEKARENFKRVVIEENNNEVVEENKKVINEEIQSLNVEGEETNVVGADAHSIWFEGIEFKILEYIDENDMLVKFALDDYIMQAVVPRELEEGNYISEHYTEWSANGERCEVYLKLINASKKDAIYFAYAIGPEMESEFKEWQKLVDNEEMIQFRTSGDKEGLVASGYESIAWNEYDKDKVSLPGYSMVVWNEEESMICAMATLNEDEQRNEEIKENLKEIKIKKVVESDFYLKSDTVVEEYDMRMSAMYQKYVDIIGSPTEYLKQNADAQGEDYTYHYLYDLTNDAIPELIFKGNPRCIAIVGEKNAISLLGCDEIYLTDTPNIFYTQVAWQTDVTWTKHETKVNEEGLLILNSSNYLEQNYEGVHRLQGEEITEEEYMKIVDEITSKDRPRMKLYDLDEEMASMGSFYRSVQLLSDNVIQ